MSGRNTITLVLDEEKDLAPKAFFTHSQWDLDAAVVSSSAPCDFETIHVATAESAPLTMPGDEDDDTCLHCFCKPGVTDLGVFP